MNESLVTYWPVEQLSFKGAATKATIFGHEGLE